MKNCPETTTVKTVNWRYRIANSLDSNVSEIPTQSSVPVMNWRYRMPDLDYKVLTIVKSTAEVNWRYRIAENFAYDSN
jgi:hypothetical protein